MKVQQLLILATVLMLTVGCNKNNNSDTVDHQSETESKTISTGAKTGVKSGVFLPDKEPTEGTIKLIKQNGKQYIELQSDFKTVQGPDLFVLLHKQEKPSSYNKTDYVKLGALKKVTGQQIYEIPTKLNLKDFNSVVIWCRKFKVTFGHAVIVK